MQTDWVSRFSGPGAYEDSGNAICVDDSGNVYVTGAVQLTSLALTCTTIKYNKFGDSIWVREYRRPNNQYDQGNDIVLDDSGNVVVAGAKSVIKYENNGNVKWIAYDSADYKKIIIDPKGFIYAAGLGAGRYVVTKYDQNGNKIWINKHNGAHKLYDLKMDISGNILITGYNEYILTYYDYTTIKYSGVNGNIIWKRNYNGVAPPPLAADYSYALTTDNQANVYVTGASQDANSDFNCTTVKYDSSGNVIWVKRIYPPSNGYDIEVDQHQNVYLAGRSSGYNFTFKLDMNGSVVWTGTYPTTNIYATNFPDLILDSVNNIYVTANIDSNNFTRYGAIKYDNNGYQMFVVEYYTTANRVNYVHDMFVDRKGSVYLTGKSQGPGTYYDYATVKYSPIITGIQENAPITDSYSLEQNYPNPFNPRTIINFQLGIRNFVSLKVYDITGKEVATLVNDIMPAGRHAVEFNAAALSSGVYFCTMKAGSYQKTLRMAVVK